MYCIPVLYKQPLQLLLIPKGVDGHGEINIEYSILYMNCCIIIDRCYCSFAFVKQPSCLQVQHCTRELSTADDGDDYGW